MSGQAIPDKPLLTPIYLQTEPNQPIDLGSVAIEFQHKDVTYRGTANATMKFLPDRDLTLVVPMEDDGPCSTLVGAGTKLAIAFPERGVTVDAFCSAIGGKYGGTVFSPTRSGITVTSPSSEISKVMFHLLKFPDFWGPEERGLEAGERAGHCDSQCRRAVLKAGGWVITVVDTDKTYELEKDLDSQGGYVITHVGEIVREDATSFTSEQLDDLLACLHHFLSFALGCWAGVACLLDLTTREAASSSNGEYAESPPALGMEWDHGSIGTTASSSHRSFPGSCLFGRARFGTTPWPVRCIGTSERVQASAKLALTRA